VAEVDCPAIKREACRMMNSKSRCLAIGLALAWAPCLLALEKTEQIDPVSVSPDKYEVILENERLQDG
jgi:hypothetical protein